MTMDHKDVKRGALIELRDGETGQWLPLRIVSIVYDNVECRTLANEPIYAKASALVKDARLRPSDGTCRDCGCEAHDGPCVDRICAECKAAVRSRCAQHPEAPVHVYRRTRYLAEIEEDKPYPTRESSRALQQDLLEQMRALRLAEEIRQNRYMINGLVRSEILSALESAVRLIDALPTDKRKGR